MSSDIEARLARLERAVSYSLGIDLNEHNDADQEAAKEKQDDADQKAVDKQTAQLTKDAEKEAGN